MKNALEITLLLVMIVAAAIAAVVAFRMLGSLPGSGGGNISDEFPGLGRIE